MSKSLITATLACLTAIAGCSPKGPPPPAPLVLPVPDPAAAFEPVPPGQRPPSLSELPAKGGRLWIEVAFSGEGATPLPDGTTIEVRLLQGADEVAAFNALVKHGRAALQFERLVAGEYVLAIRTVLPSGASGSARLGPYVVAAGQPLRLHVPCRLEEPPRWKGPDGVDSPPDPPPWPTTFAWGVSSGGVSVIEREPVLTTPSTMGRRYRISESGHAPPQVAAPCTIDDDSRLPLTPATIRSTEQGHYVALASRGPGSPITYLGPVSFAASRHDPNNTGRWTLTARIGDCLKKFYCDETDHVVGTSLSLHAITELLPVDPEEVHGQTFYSVRHPEGVPARLFYFLDDRATIHEVFLGDQDGPDGLLGLSFPDPGLGFVYIQRRTP